MIIPMIFTTNGIIVITNTPLTQLLRTGGLVDDTHSDSLSHITDGETTERRILREGLNAQRLGGDEESHHRLSVLDDIGVLTEDLSGTLIDLLMIFSNLQAM